MEGVRTPPDGLGLPAKSPAHPIRSAPFGHAGFQRSSRHVLRFRIGTAKTRVAVIGVPAIFVVAIRVIHRVLRLISRGIDEGKRLARHSCPSAHAVSGCPKYSSQGARVGL